MDLKLVPPKPEYAEEFLRWREDPITVKFNPLKKSSLEELKTRLLNAGTSLTNIEGSIEFIWFVKDGAELVGQVSLQNVNPTMLTGEIAYTICPTARSKGTGTEAVRLLTKLIFENSRLRRLFAHVHVENLASRRVLEKNGYALEGVLRQHFIVNGQPTDEALYAILRSDLVQLIELEH